MLSKSQPVCAHLHSLQPRSSCSCTNLLVKQLPLDMGSSVLVGLNLFYHINWNLPNNVLECREYPAQLTLHHQNHLHYIRHACVYHGTSSETIYYVVPTDPVPNCLIKHKNPRFHTPQYQLPLMAYLKLITQAKLLMSIIYAETLCTPLSFVSAYIMFATETLTCYVFDNFKVREDSS